MRDVLRPFLPALDAAHCGRNHAIECGNRQTAAPDLTKMFRTGDLKADPAADAGRAAIGRVTSENGNAII